MAMDLSTSYNQRTEKVCISDEMMRKKVVMLAANVRQKTGIVKTVKLRKTVGMVNRVRQVKLNKGYWL
jgi:hypothetical protein